VDRADGCRLLKGDELAKLGVGRGRRIGGAGSKNHAEEGSDERRDDESADPRCHRTSDRRVVLAAAS
jgi:hypothetical protein